MTVTKYLNQGSKKEYEFYTVEELRDDLDKLVSAGKGNFIIMLPIVNKELYGNAEYMLANKTDSFVGVDSMEQCAYLEALPDEVDYYIASQILK